MEFIHNLTIETKQTLSPAQIQSLEILAMDMQELNDFLKDEYLSNPLLEYTSGAVSHHDYVSFSSNDIDTASLLVAPDKDYLKNHLTSQLDIQRFSKKDWRLILYLIDCLEDNGYFKLDLDEISRLTGATSDKLKEILDYLQDLEPYGIFAPDLASSLIKQLNMSGIHNPVLEEIIRYHLLDISEGRISTISRKLHLSTEQVRKYIAIIAKLNPNPLSCLQDKNAAYHVPDIIFEKTDGIWEIRTNDAWLGKYSINEHYLKMMENTNDPELFSYFQTKLERSRFLVHCIEQRQQTMIKICNAVLEKQQEYFNDMGQLKSMTMAELAQHLRIHPSTVTRAVRGKYLQFPKGTILMKDLFSTAVCGSSDGSGQNPSFSAAHIKERIKELIYNEDKKKPLSDAKLANILADEGINISRRALAKYRDELFIKSSFDRKER